MIVSRIRNQVKQLCWGVGHYREAAPILNCLEEVLTNWSFRANVQVLVTPWRENGCHLHTKALVKLGNSVYPLILSETCEANVLAYSQNDITYLLSAVIEETEQELFKLMSAGVEIIDPLAAMLLEMEQATDTYQDIRE
jgi:hypothetical protein